MLELQVRRFFENDNDHEEPATISFAAKRTRTDTAPPTQLGWVFRVRQLARTIKVPAFSTDNLRDALPKLRSLLIHPEAVAEVPAILAECGVRLVLVEVLPGAKIDGVCTWLDDKSPVIGLSTLHDRLDNFWFVLRHEIEHVLEGHGKDRIAIFDYFPGEAATLMAGAVEEEEWLANAAAAEFCIPQAKMDSFYTRKHPYFSEKDVLGFASVNGVHPGIAVGQLQYRLGRFDYLRKYQVPIRKFLQSEVLTDGWGDIVEAEL
ncbi:MAG TPA: ImmA/IrrE family metallo-endopeptidase [Sphingomicrobium sp.]|nr:ImmA/IrrE family metallo-endopeptidase [Sphingomicrobium sp.]